MYSQYLKLYNYCLENIEPLTYRALVQTILQTKLNDRQEKVPVLRRDVRMIGLFFEKFIKRQINAPQRKMFLKELYASIRYHYSMKILLCVPNYLNLLNDFLNLDPNEDGADGEVRTIIQKILRRFIIYTLFDEEQRVSSLIALMEFDSFPKQGKSAFESNLKKISGGPEPQSQLSNQNFFKLLKPIEVTFRDQKEFIIKSWQQQEENKSDYELITNKTVEAMQARKTIFLNVSQFVYYYEYFLIKSGKAIEQEESQICQFTSTLVDFLHSTLLLYVVYPPVKQPPSELSSNNLGKRFENLCYRNGGLFISTLTIIFTILHNTKIVTEKIGLLKNVSTILGLNKRRSSPETTQNKTSPSPVYSSKSDIGQNPLKELFIEAAKKYPSNELKQYLITPLLESPNADKLPDLLLQKDLVMISEFCFSSLFKLISREVKISPIIKSSTKHREFDEQDTEILEILQTNETADEFDQRGLLHSEKYIMELVLLLTEVLSINGTAIKTSIRQNYVPYDRDQDKGDKFSLKKIMNRSALPKKISETETRVKNNLASVKMDLEAFCEEYNDQNKPIRRQETSNVGDKQTFYQHPLKVDVLIQLCKGDSPSNKGQKSTALSSKPTLSDPIDTLQSVREFISESKELKNEIAKALKNGTLKPIRFVKIYMTISLIINKYHIDSSIELLVLQVSNREAVY